MWETRLDVDGTPFATSNRSDPVSRIVFVGRTEVRPKKSRMCEGSPTPSIRSSPKLFTQGRNHPKALGLLPSHPDPTITEAASSRTKPHERSASSPLPFQRCCKSLSRSGTTRGYSASRHTLFQRKPKLVAPARNYPKALGSPRSVPKQLAQKRRRPASTSPIGNFQNAISLTETETVKKENLKYLF